MGMYHVGIGLTDWLNIVNKRQHDITMITERMKIQTLKVFCVVTTASPRR